jgi:hypothetical protein
MDIETKEVSHCSRVRVFEFSIQLSNHSLNVLRTWCHEGDKTHKVYGFNCNHTESGEGICKIGALMRNGPHGIFSWGEKKKTSERVCLPCLIEFFWGRDRPQRQTIE